MNRAVFGGSFDPVHTGHLLAARAILDRGLADRVHVVPAWLSPHKPGFCASPEHRLAMVRLVFDDQAGVVVETLEMDRAAPSFSVDTLSELMDRHPGDRFRVVMGADQLAVFGQWRAPEKILKQADLIILARQTGNLRILCEQAGIPQSSCHLLTDFDERVSATSIRAKLVAGNEPGPGLDPAVFAYIREHSLYRD